MLTPLPPESLTVPKEEVLLNLHTTQPVILMRGNAFPFIVALDTLQSNPIRSN